MLFSLCVLLIFAGSSCRREKTAVLKGRLFDNCLDSEPLANKKVYFRIGKFGGHTDPVAETTTDADGYFTVSYTTRSRRSLIMQVGGMEMQGIPSRKNIDFGNVYTDLATRAVVKVKVNDAHASASDVLRVNNNTLMPFQMATPFHDTVFPVMIFHSTDIPLKYGKPVAEEHSFAIAWTFDNGLFPQQQQQVMLSRCSEIPDTILITID
jgi:hypothetical protein